MPSLTVSPIDLTILIIYVLGSRIIFGWYIARKRRQHDSESYFLGGRNLQSILSYITPPVVVVFLMGIFWRKGTASAAFATLAFGVPIGISGWYLNEVAGIYQIQFLYACGLMTLLSSLVFFGVTLITARPSPVQIESLTWNPAYWRTETAQLRQIPWYRNYRYQSFGLMFHAAVILAMWW